MGTLFKLDHPHPGLRPARAGQHDFKCHHALPGQHGGSHTGWAMSADVRAVAEAERLWAMAMSVACRCPGQWSTR